MLPTRNSELKDNKSFTLLHRAASSNIVFGFPDVTVKVNVLYTLIPFLTQPLCNTQMYISLAELEIISHRNAPAHLHKVLIKAIQHEYTVIGLLELRAPPHHSPCEVVISLFSVQLKWP